MNRYFLFNQPLFPMRSIQSRLVNQAILIVNQTFSIQQILFDSIQSIYSRMNQTPVWR